MFHDPSMHGHNDFYGEVVFSRFISRQTFPHLGNCFPRNAISKKYIFYYIKHLSGSHPLAQKLLK